MLSILKYLLSSQLINSQKNQRDKGFTLIELQVAVILAFLVITPLLGFMINILDTDRREQAKATSEQEIQTAIDYISRDLEQAIYVYDADGLTRNFNSNPSLSGIKDQIPPAKEAPGCRDANECQPILVFWKRKLLEDAITVPNSTATDNLDDTFVYSLVAYYLIKDSNTTWSKAARIARFEISDGVQSRDGINCPGYPLEERYINGRCPNPGFKRFDLTKVGNNLREKLNQWEAAGSKESPYTQRVDVLVDYIDQSITSVPPATCPANTNDTTWSIVAPTNMTGFYACVETRKTLNSRVQVFLRGNALARVQSNNLNYSENNKTYFPSASVRVEGRSYLFTR
ncbi:MAG: hypothetical protein IGS39_10855 [Calothrix sp. C42_A2020_038]|nr:hypothetical protein [Calothrix sp. C42_A2020_038]